MCLPVLGAVIGLAGNVMSGMAANSSAKANAKSMEQQARMEREAGAYQAKRQSDQLARVTGRQINNFAANGLALDGSAADVVEDSRREGEMDIAATLYGANVRAQNLETQAKITKASGKSALVGSVISGFGKLAEAGYDAYKNRTTVQGFY